MGMIDILVLLLLCKGVPGQLPNGYSIDVAQYVLIQENQCVTIHCTFIAENKNTFTSAKGYWMTNAQNAVAYSKKEFYKYGSPQPNFHATGNPDKGDCSLTITNANKGDTGSYFFRFEGPSNFSYLMNRVHAVVTDLTDKPEIRQSDLLVVGQNVTLTCIVPGNCSGASPKIQWRKSDVDNIWGESSTLTFSPKPSDHQTTVTCEVSFSKARTSAMKTLDVLYPPQSLEIVAASSNGRLQYNIINGSVIVQNSESLTLKCSADGNPPAKSNWSKTTDPGFEGSIITIDYPVEEILRCVAVNDYGSTEKHLKIILHGVPGQLPNGYSIDVAPYVPIQENQCVTIPCTFIAQNKNTFTNGKGYWMTNAQNAVAYSKKEFYKYGSPRPNFHATGNPDKGDCSLTITNASKGDTGSYFFRFEGPSNFSYLMNRVIAVVTDLTDKPEIRQSDLLVVGQNVTLTCIVPGNCSGASPKIQWRKSDVDNIWGESSTLTFSPKPSDHQTTVTCEVSFSKARTSAMKTLDILYPPQSVEIVAASSNGRLQYNIINGSVIVQNSESLTLKCSADGNPPAKSNWSKTTGPGFEGSIITIDYPVEEILRCVAVNDYGSTEKHLKIILHVDGTKYILIAGVLGILLVLMVAVAINVKHLLNRRKNIKTNTEDFCLENNQAVNQNDGYHHNVYENHDRVTQNIEALSDNLDKQCSDYGEESIYADE